MNNDPLPSPKQRELLCEMIQFAFIEIRALGRDGHAEQAGDLADAFHNISREMYGWGSFKWSIFRGMLESYEEKYKANRRGWDYASKLDEIMRVS